MKFGDNFGHLSNKWNSYNIDYNELKRSIRVITSLQLRSITTSQLSSQLERLEQEFIQQIDFLNLFVGTKHSELSHKLSSYHESYSNTITNPSSDVDQNRLLHKLNHLSSQVKELSNFMLYQKIALNKLFKKYSKHYKKNFAVYSNESSKEQLDVLASYKYLNEKIFNYLDQNEKSFTNLSLNKIIFDLTIFLELIKNSPSSISNRLNSVYNININNLNYDLNCMIKNPYNERYILEYDNLDNLKLSLLNLNSSELSLSLINENLNELKEIFQSPNHRNVNPDTLISYIYLTSESDPSLYSIIISEKNKKDSMILSPIGKLTNFSYSYLSNDIINTFILSDSVGINEIHQHCEYKGLTKLTIDLIINNNLKPSFKVFMNRTRFYSKFTRIDKFNISITNDSFIYIDSNIKYLHATDLKVEFGNHTEFTNFRYCQLVLNHNNYSNDDSKIFGYISELNYLYKVNFTLLDFLNYKFFNIGDDSSWEEFNKMDLKKKIELDSMNNIRKKLLAPIINDPPRVPPKGILLNQPSITTPQIETESSRYWNEFDNESFRESMSFENYSMVDSFLERLILFFKKLGLNHPQDLHEYDNCISRRYSQSQTRRLSTYGAVAYLSDSEDDDVNVDQDGEISDFLNTKQFNDFLKIFIVILSLVSFAVLISTSLILFYVKNHNSSSYPGSDFNTPPNVLAIMIILIGFMVSFIFSCFAFFLVSNYSILILNLESMENKLTANMGESLSEPDWKESLFVYANFAIVCFGFTYGFIYLFDA